MPTGRREKASSLVGSERSELLGLLASPSNTARDHELGEIQLAKQSQSTGAKAVNARENVGHLGTNKWLGVGCCYPKVLVVLNKMGGVPHLRSSFLFS